MPHEYSLDTLIAARHGISAGEQKRISRYTRRGVSAMLRRNLRDDRAYWGTLTEGAEILFYHPDPIVRHEAAFVLGEVCYRSDLERTVAIRDLRWALRQDPSIVAKHEIAEALGTMFGIGAVGAAADMAKILIFPHLHHPDVVATAREAYGNLVGYLERRGYTQAVRELGEWTRHAR